MKALRKVFANKKKREGQSFELSSQTFSGTRESREEFTVVRGRWLSFKIVNRSAIGVASIKTRDGDTLWWCCPWRTALISFTRLFCSTNYSCEAVAAEQCLCRADWFRAPSPADTRRRTRISVALRLATPSFRPDSSARDPIRRRLIA